LCFHVLINLHAYKIESVQTNVHLRAAKKALEVFTQVAERLSAVKEAMTKQNLTIHVMMI